MKTCAEYSDLILEYLDDAATFEVREDVEAHLASCAECRRFYRDQRQLDERLRRVLVPAGVSPRFRQNLLDRVDAELVSADDGRRAAAAKVEAEHRERLARLRTEVFGLTPTRAMDALGCVVAAGLVCWIVWTLGVPAVAQWAAGAGLRFVGPAQVVAWGTALACLAAAVGFVLRQGASVLPRGFAPRQ